MLNYSEEKAYYNPLSYEVNHKVKEIRTLAMRSSYLISRLTKKALKRANSRRNIFDSMIVSSFGMRCHFVCDIKEADEANFMRAIKMWNNQQPYFRKMVIGKGQKTKKAMYVVFSNKFRNNHGSFWICYEN